MIDFKTHILPLKDGLYRLALRITLNHQEAEDIVQETLIKLWDKRNLWDTIDSISAYAMTACINLALDHIKKKENQNASLDASLIEQPDMADSPISHAIYNDSITRIQELVNALPEKQRTCMQLRDFEGMTYKDIARILSISEEQVKINIFRARKAVKQSFIKQEQYGI